MMDPVEATFKERLGSQWRTSPHIQAIVEILSDPMQDSLSVMEYILAHLSIDTAEGELLDFLGELVGVVRPPLQETRIFTLGSLGDADDPDNDHGFLDDTDTVETGGFLGSVKGLADQDDPDAKITDANFRYLIRQKAASYRKKMMRETLFLYLIAFGGRCKIDDDTTLTVVIDPVTYHDFDHWTQYYIPTRGYNPGGIKVRIRDNMRDGDSI